MTRQEELQKEGWIRQFMTDEPRLSEAVEEYQELGFEILVEPMDSTELTGECTSCLMATPDRSKIIYIRQKRY